MSDAGLTLEILQGVIDKFEADRRPYDEAETRVFGQPLRNTTIIIPATLDERGEKVPIDTKHQEILELHNDCILSLYATEIAAVPNTRTIFARIEKKQERFVPSSKGVW